MTAIPRRSSESLSAFNAAFPDDAACVRHIFDARYGQGTSCRTCGRPARWKQGRGKRFESACCHYELTPTAGTFLSHSHAPLTRAFYAILLVSIFDGQISANVLARQLGVTVKTAWRLADRIRVQMSLLARPVTLPYGGTVFVDEMHLGRVISRAGVAKPAIIFGITDGRDCTFFCVPNRKADTLCAVVERMVLPETRIVVDGFSAYNRLADRGYRLSRVIHSKGMWKNASGDSTSLIERRWVSVRERIERVHQRVYAEHLWKYLGQLSFILSCRKEGQSPFWSSISSFPDLSDAALAGARDGIDLAGVAARSNH
jgi:transposase